MFAAVLEAFSSVYPDKEVPNKTNDSPTGSNIYGHSVTVTTAHRAMKKQLQLQPYWFRAVHQLILLRKLCFSISLVVLCVKGCLHSGWCHVLNGMFCSLWLGFSPVGYVPEYMLMAWTLVGLTGVPSVAMSVMLWRSMVIWTPHTVHSPATKRKRNLLPLSTHTSLYGTGEVFCWPAAVCNSGDLESTHFCHHSWYVILGFWPRFSGLRPIKITDFLRFPHAFQPKYWLVT